MCIRTAARFAFLYAAATAVWRGFAAPAYPPLAVPARSGQHSRAGRLLLPAVVVQSGASYEPGGNPLTRRADIGVCAEREVGGHWEIRVAGLLMCTRATAVAS